MTSSNESDPRSFPGSEYLPKTPFKELSEEEQLEYLRMAEIIDSEYINYDRHAYRPSSSTLTESAEEQTDI